MKKKDYFDEVDQMKVDDEFKKRLKNRLHDERMKPVRRYGHVYFLGAAIICAVFLVCFAVVSSTKQDSPIPAPQVTKQPVEELKKLTIPNQLYGNYGYEGYFEKDPKELAYGDLGYAKKNIERLPVLKNQSVRERSGFHISGMDEQEMRKIANEYNEKLGFTKLEESFEYNLFQIQCVEGNIQVERNGEVRIEYYEVPDSASNILMNPTSLEEANQLVSQLVTAYQFLIPEGDYLPDIFLDYSYFAQPHWGFFAYERKAETMEQFLSFHFNRIEFVPNDHGELWMIRIQFKDASESLGNYPIIHEEEARLRLKNGNFLTSCPVLADMSNIAYVELLYYLNEINEEFLPYYKFYIENNEDVERIDASLKSYHTYYVPAIEDAYLVELPDNSIYFN